MNISKKIALMSASLISMAALTACQSMQPPTKYNSDGDRQQSKNMMKKGHKAQHHHPKHHQSHMQVFHQACENKTLGETVQIQIAERTVEGQCNVVFKPTQKQQLKNITLAPSAAIKPTENQTKNQITNQTKTEKRSREQRLQHNQQRHATYVAQRNALNQACEGQKNGQNIQAKWGEQLIDGQCQLVFHRLKNANRSTSTFNN